MDHDRADTSPERVGNLPQTSSHTRHAVGIVSFEPNDDFAMGAPPGAPGAIEGPAPTTAPADLEMRPRPGQPDVTPRAVTTDLPTIILVTTGQQWHCPSGHSRSSSASEQHPNPRQVLHT